MINLESGENVLLEIRRHLFAFYISLTGIALSALLPLIVYQLVEAFAVQYIPSSSIFFFSFIYVLWLLVLWISVFISWTDYYLDTWIVTNKHVIDFEMKGLFSREIASVKIENIQDVKINITGLINTYLNVGDIHIQTAGRDKEFVITNAHRPDKAKEIILSASSKTVEQDGEKLLQTS